MRASKIPFQNKDGETGVEFEHKYFDLFIVIKSKHQESKVSGVKIPLVMREHSKEISLRKCYSVISLT